MSERTSHHVSDTLDGLATSVDLFLLNAFVTHAQGLECLSIRLVIPQLRKGLIVMSQHGLDIHLSHVLVCASVLRRMLCARHELRLKRDVLTLESVLHEIVKLSSIALFVGVTAERIQ